MIFNLFKPTPTLKDLIPNDFVDIHSHILPGIDDGAKNIEESLALISEMKKMGFSKIIGTPHTYPGLYENTTKSIEESFTSINNKKSGEIKLGYASEYLIDISLLEKINKKDILTIKDNFVLLEFSFISEPMILREIIFEFITNGYTPIIAHPERYQYYHNNLNKVYQLKKLGCKLQLNLLSIVGTYGKGVLKFSEKLLKNKLIDFVGSDIHSICDTEKLKNKIIINSIDQIENAINNNNQLFL